MSPHSPAAVPRQDRRTTAYDDLEREVARTAELVLRLTALADRYEARALGREQVALIRGTVLRAQQAIVRAAERLPG